MEYRSPVRLVVHAAEPIQFYQPQAINRTRKKLLAEMALQDQLITLDGILYTRNDVIVLLDSITSEEIWKAHYTIYSHKALLDFLERQTFDPEGFKAAETLLYDGRFKAFVSPYFTAAFDKVLNELLRDEKYASLNSLLLYNSFIHPDQEHEAYRRVRIYLDELGHMLKNLNWEKFSADESILYFLYEEEWIRFVNRLPPSFDTARDELVRLLLQVVYRFQRKSSWYYLYRCCLQIKKIESSEGQTVQEYEKIMKENSRAETNKGSKSSGRPSVLRIVFICIWVVFLIYRWGNGCGSNVSKYDYSKIQRVSRDHDSFYVELNSSENERNFKEFLADTRLSPSSGEPVEIEPGTAPFTWFSRVPYDDGVASFKVTNNTGYDVVMFYFANTNRLINEQSQVYAVYIKDGQFYEFSFRPNFSRFNFVMGKQWIHLKESIPFTLYDYEKKGSYGSRVSREGEPVGTLNVDGYFQHLPGVEQYYLNHDIIPQDFRLESEVLESGAEAPTLIYDPTFDKDGNTIPPPGTELVLNEKGGRIIIQASGTLALYESPKTF
jgi:hypothetical protein